MGRPKVTKDELTVREQAQIATNAQENALYIGHSLAGLTAEPVNLFDTAEVERRTMEYIADCQRTGTRVTPPGLALWLGITSEDLKKWLTGFGNDEQRRTALRINQFLHANFADNALLNKTSPALSMFIMKNWFGYKENANVESAESVEKIRTLDELQKEAESLPDFEIIETQGKKGNK
jgi:hypothetical protein